MNAHSSPGTYGAGFNGVALDGVEWETDGFVVGDIVNLITGSPDLAVLSACDECGSVEVAWFDGASLSVQFLPEEVLVHAD